MIFSWSGQRVGEELFTSVPTSKCRKLSFWFLVLEAFLRLKACLLHTFDLPDLYLQGIQGATKIILFV